MFRPIAKVLDPFKFIMVRALAGEGAAGAGAGAGGGSGGAAAGDSAFARNSVTREQALGATLRSALPGITYLSVHDISGGCGAMFEISVEACEFRGLSVVQQHRLVTGALRDHIRDMHGLRVHTAPAAPAAPSNDEQHLPNDR